MTILSNVIVMKIDGRNSFSLIGGSACGGIALWIVRRYQLSRIATAGVVLGGSTLGYMVSSAIQGVSQKQQKTPQSLEEVIQALKAMGENENDNCVLIKIHEPNEGYALLKRWRVAKFLYNKMNESSIYYKRLSRDKYVERYEIKKMKKRMGGSFLKWLRGF